MTEVTGIDCSHHQKPTSLDYQRAAKEHRFMIARASYGTRSDITFREHIRSARNAGMWVGAYLYYRQSQDAEAQLESFLGELEAVELGESDIVPVLDVEYLHGSSEKHEGPLNRDRYHADCSWILRQLLRQLGGAMAYTYTAFYAELGNPGWLSDYPLWIADYRDEPKFPTHPDIRIHQWTGTGKADWYGNGKLPIDLNRAVGAIPVLRPVSIPPAEGHIDDFLRRRVRAAQADITDRALHGELSDTDPAPPPWSK